MHKACVKHVDAWRKRNRKSSVRLSTKRVQTFTTATESGVNAQLITTFIPSFPLHISPLKIASLPLVEHYFYPVSTAPIINTTK